MTSIKRNPWVLIFAVFFALGAISCSDETESELVDVDNFSNSAIDGMQRGAIGKTRCLELIFPVTVQFSDESTAEVSSYEELHEAISAWLEENGLERSRDNKPELVFPVQVVSEDGTVTDVEDADALQALKSECKGDKDTTRRGNCGKNFSCFELSFPVSVVIDGETLGFDTKEDFKTALKTYRQENGRDAERPSLVFPVTIVYEDDSEVVVDSAADLQAAKQACREEE